MCHALLRKKRQRRGWMIRGQCCPSRDLWIRMQKSFEKHMHQSEPTVYQAFKYPSVQPPSPRFYSSQQGGSLEPGSRTHLLEFWCRHHNWNHAKAHGVIWDLTSWLGVYPGVFFKKAEFHRGFFGRVLLTHVTNMYPWFINDVSKWEGLLSSKGSCISKPSRPNHRDSTHDAHK